jgi:crotonobetainyl-CoA:carnitine CoA-transferase CaiB-like acyl-CoA transferase
MEDEVLSHCRVLDLTDEKGFLCGKILADLGADVLKVEKPGGDLSRRIGPFWNNVPDGEKSLNWFAYNVNKRGITLDIETEDGRRIFKELAGTSDFVVESFDPGYMEGLGLGYNDLRKIKKEIILASITPFGRKGPYKGFKASDIVIMGMSGMLYLTGNTDESPVNISIPQACLHAGADAAVGSLIAYYERKKSGEGQHVDVSMQQSSAWFLAMTIPYWELERKILKRAGAHRVNSLGTIQRQMWRCKDGYIFFFMLGGITGARVTRKLVQWMEDEGHGDEYLSSFDWEQFDMSTVTQKEIDSISKPIAEFFKNRSKKEILAEAVKRSISICPLLSMQDLLDDSSLNSRDYWMEIEHPELRSKLPFPRQFFKSSERIIHRRFKAPLIGEHNEEIYAELSLNQQDLILLKQAGII